KWYPQMAAKSRLSRSWGSPHTPFLMTGGVSSTKNLIVRPRFVHARTLRLRLRFARARFRLEGRIAHHETAHSPKTTASRHSTGRRSNPMSHEPQGVDRPYLPVRYRS